MSKSYFCRTESYIIEDDFFPRSCYFLGVYAAVGVFGTQKGDNFRVLDRVFVGPFDITAVSQYLWA